MGQTRQKLEAKQVKQLSKQVANLQHRLDELTERHRLYQSHHQLMQCLAEGLQVFSVYQAFSSLSSAGPSPDSEPPDHAELLQSLLSAEHSLLQQLEHAGVGSCSTSSSTSSFLEDTPFSTISPRSDPMAHFKMILQHTPRLYAAGMADMTAEQLARQVRQSIGQLSRQLVRLQVEIMAPEAAQAIKDSQDRYYQEIACLIVLGKADVIAQLQSFNLDTLQSDPSHQEAATQHTLQVAPHLGLTEQQAYAISTGVELYLNLMKSIQTEQARLKAALAAPPAAPCSTSCWQALPQAFPPSSNSAAAGLLSCPSSSSADLGDRVQELEEQQQLYERLQLLLQKEYVMQAVMCGWLVGSLSYEQLAKAHVLCWPYVLRIPHLGIGIQEWYTDTYQHSRVHSR